MATRTVNTTVGKNSWRAVVSAAVAFGLAFLAAHVGSFSWVHLSYIWGIVTPAYFGAVSWLEAKFPSFSWFFLLFPQPPAPVTPPTPSTFVETDKGVWAADVNAMEKATEVAKTLPAAKSKPKTKR